MKFSKLGFGVLDGMNDNKFQLAEIERIRALISPCLRRTPLLDSFCNQGLFLKAENLQNTHSFKVRAAAGQMLSLSEAELQQGLVTSSSGNFGQAAAFVARRLGCPLQVVMTRDSSPLKVALTQRLGAKVVFCDNDFRARQARVEQIKSSRGATEVHPFEHPNAILGNASLGLEILEQKPATWHIVVPVSGGGLISGVALGARLLNPAIQIWGVQAEGSNAAYLSFLEGRVQQLEHTRTIADGLRANRPGDLTFSLIQDYVDSVVTVKEKSILLAVARFLSEERLVVEPSGAVTLAAVLEGKIPAQDTVLVLSGGNIDPAVLEESLLTVRKRS